MIWLALVVAYLIGGMPFSYWLVRWQRPGSDLRLLGSGNPGATNALRVGGRTIGLITLVLDVLKGMAAVGVAARLGVEGSQLAAVAAAAVVGHVAPIWLGFRGGKGVATACGGLLMLAPLTVAAAGTVFLGLLVATRIVAVSSIGAAVTLPVAQWMFVGGGSAEQRAVILWITLISLLVVVRHRSNLVRVLSGRENRLGGSMTSGHER